MSNPGAFGDLGKESTSALLRGREFVSKPNVELTTTSTNKVKAIGKINKEDDGKLVGSVEFKLPKTNGVETGVSLDSNNKAKVSVSVSDKFTAGLKQTFAIEGDLTKSPTFKAGVEYRRPRLTSGVTFAFPWADKGAASLLSSLVLGFDEYGVAAGVEADYGLNTSAFKTINATVAYRYNPFVTTAFARFKGNNAIYGATFFSKINTPTFTNGEVAAEIQYDASKASDNVTVTLGSAYDVSADSRASITFDTKYKLTAQLSNKLNQNTRFNIGTVHTINKADAQPKFFAGLSFTD